MFFFRKYFLGRRFSRFEFKVYGYDLKELVSKKGFVVRNRKFGFLFGFDLFFDYCVENFV